MNKNVLIAIIVSVAIIIAAGIVAFGMMNANHEKVIVMNNTTGNNTIHNNTTIEKTTNDNDQQTNNNNKEAQDTLKESQDTLKESQAYNSLVEQGKQSRDNGGQCAGMSDEQIEQMSYNDMMYGRV